MTTRTFVLTVAAALGLACKGSEPKTAEEKKAKGDQILREMSSALAGVKNFSFTAEEVSEKVGPGGQKTQEKLVRRVVVRRPDGFFFQTEGGHGTTVWYDGKKATIISDEKKLWARGSMPPTLDETLDYAAAVYDLKLPWADLLYSSPYDALVSPDTTGGWVGVETIDGQPCDHLSYQNPVVDWEIWVGRDEAWRQAAEDHVQAGSRSARHAVSFRDQNLSPKVDEKHFHGEGAGGLHADPPGPPRLGPGAGRDRGGGSVTRRLPAPTPSGR